MTLVLPEHKTSVRTSTNNVRISIPGRAATIAIFMLDVVLVAVITSVTIVDQGDPVLWPSSELIHPFAIVAPSVCLLPLLLMWSGLYHSNNLLSFHALVVTFSRIGLYYSFVTTVAAFLLHVRLISSILLINPILFTPFALFIHHILWLAALTICNKVGCFGGKQIVVLYLGASIDVNFRGTLKRIGYRVLDEFAFNSGRSSEFVRQALAFARGSGAQELFVVGDYDQLVPSAIEQLTASAIPVYVLPTGSLAELLKGPLWRVGSAPVFELRRGALSGVQQLIKRVTDILAAAVALLLLCPVFAIVAFVVKLDSSGPIIFRQTRLGVHGVPFKIYKFRTMNVLEDGADVRQASRSDPRVTRVGRWLRKTSVDELPQLVNVLKGDMSLVGPRPHALIQDSYYGELLPKYSTRQKVRPGITGWAQVNGHRGETPTTEKMAQRLGFDIWYIQHWSEAFDIEIMLRTLVHLLRSPDAY